MFRGKESSNRIELSQLVQDLLNFGVLGSLRLWGWGGWVDGGGGWLGGLGGWGWGVVGGCPPHMCTCTCMHAHTHTRACVVNIIPCKWPPPLDLGKSRGFPMMSDVRACACVHVHVHVCVEDRVTTPHPHPPTHPPPRGDPRNQSKFNST